MPFTKENHQQRRYSAILTALLDGKFKGSPIRITKEFNCCTGPLKTGETLNYLVILMGDPLNLPDNGAIKIAEELRAQLPSKH